MAREQQTRTLILIAVLVALIFVLDLWLPLGLVASVLYVIPVLISLRSEVPRVILIIAIACTVLSILGTVLSPSVGMQWVELANRGVALFAIWMAVPLGLRIRQTPGRFRRSVEEKGVKRACFYSF